MSSYNDFVPVPKSLELGRLVQAQLEKAQQELPDQRVRTLDDLKSMVRKLSGITNICEDYIINVKEKSAAQAFEEMEFGFEWDECKS